MFRQYLSRSMRVATSVTSVSRVMCAILCRAETWRGREFPDWRPAVPLLPCVVHRAIRSGLRLFAIADASCRRHPSRSHIALPGRRRRRRGGDGACMDRTLGDSVRDQYGASPHRDRWSAQDARVRLARCRPPCPAPICHQTSHARGLTWPRAQGGDGARARARLAQPRFRHRRRPPVRRPIAPPVLGAGGASCFRGCPRGVPANGPYRSTHACTASCN